MMKHLIFLSLLISSSLVFASVPMTEEELISAFNKLVWHESGSYKLPSSNATLLLTENRSVVLGDDAIQANTLFTNSHSSDVEAIVQNNSDPDAGFVIFTSLKNSGHWSSYDWENVDTKQEFLQSIIDATERENEQRRKDGLEELHVTGWVQEPIMDNESNTIRWATEVKEGNQRTINAVGLKLSRYGNEELRWIVQRSFYEKSHELDDLLQGLSFEKGNRYEDYSFIDKIVDSPVISFLVTLILSLTIATKLLFAIEQLVSYMGRGLVLLFHKLIGLFRKRQNEIADESHS